MFGGLNSNCLTNFGMVINITAASAAFLVPSRRKANLILNSWKRLRQKKGVQELQTNATSGNPYEAGDFLGKMRVVASLLWLTEVELYLT